MGKCVNLTGMRFGRLLVLKRVENDKHGASQWLCKCDCGKEHIAQAKSLKNGAIKSCGCLAIERRREACKISNSTHKLSKTRLYRVWAGMKQRCLDPKHRHYQAYGGKGIKVCADWLSFEPFHDWAIANGYDANAKRGECTLDRIDNNGNYEPSNCKWATVKEQANNKRTNRYIEYNGETHTIAEWAQIIGISKNALWERLRRKWTIEQALTKPV